MRTTIAAALPGQMATLEIEVVRIEPPATARQPTRAVVSDVSGFAELVFFRRFPAGKLAVGARLLVSGRFDERRQMVHPDHITPADRPADFPAIEQVWPLTAGLFAWHLRTPGGGGAGAGAGVSGMARCGVAAAGGLAGVSAKRWQGCRRRRNCPPLPCGGGWLMTSCWPTSWRWRWCGGGSGSGRGGRCWATACCGGKALAAFGHALTGPQAEATLAEIDADLAAPRRMLRLLQGDVGSGKTILAVLAMLRAVEAGAQAALMAPTEILARQHHRTLSRICPVPVALLTGSVTGRARGEVLARAGRWLGADGDRDARAAVGRGGVSRSGAGGDRRAASVRGGSAARAGAQGADGGCAGDDGDADSADAAADALGGDADQPADSGKPAGRAPIRTTLHQTGTLPEIFDAVARALAGPARIYWVCPLVEDSETLDVAAAEDRYATLAARFGGVVGLAHGRQDSAVREAALADFAAGRTRLLVATTVIEVGVDVPEASVMVVEHAERFGLAQLHQLRGRVGRGTVASYCLLLHDDGILEPARKRLALLRDTDDGFVLADEDFRLRGGGDLLGTRQSGERGFRIAVMPQDDGLLHMAHGDAELLLERDPKLVSERGDAARLLLRLFDRTAAWRTLRSG